MARFPAVGGGRRSDSPRSAAGGSFDSVKDRPLSERCLIGFGSTSGPPMLPVLYNNNYQIVQTPDNVMILVEMVHDARIVRMNATHASPDVRKWLGDSVGHWEGDTLVVDTTNFTDKTRFRGSSENLHVIERFTRTDAGHHPVSRHHRRSGDVYANRGPSNIRSWRPRVRCTNTPATKATTR